MPTPNMKLFPSFPHSLPYQQSTREGNESAAVRKSKPEKNCQQNNIRSLLESGACNVNDKTKENKLKHAVRVSWARGGSRLRSSNWGERLGEGFYIVDKQISYTRIIQLQYFLCTSLYNVKYCRNHNDKVVNYFYEAGKYIKTHEYCI